MKHIRVSRHETAVMDSGFRGIFVVILALVAGAMYFVFLLVYNLVWFRQNTQPRRTQLQATA